MTCKEVQKVNRFQGAVKLPVELERHIEGCPACRASFATERLTVSLLSTLSTQRSQGAPPNPFWMSRLKYRIHEMKEQGVSSWEAAIVGLRGWITALGAVAIILIALSLEWQRPEMAQTVTRIEQEVQDVDPNSVEELIGNISDAPRKIQSNLYE